MRATVAGTTSISTTAAAAAAATAAAAAAAAAANNIFSLIHKFLEKAIFYQIQYHVPVTVLHCGLL